MSESIGRPRTDPAGPRRSIGISLSPTEADALRELSEVINTSQGIACGKAIMEKLKRERRKRT